MDDETQREQEQDETERSYNDTITHKIWHGTLKKLRRIYAETGETQVSILDRIVDEEYKRVMEE